MTVSQRHATVPAPVRIFSRRQSGCLDAAPAVEPPYSKRIEPLRGNCWGEVTTSAHTSRRDTACTRLHPDNMWKEVCTVRRMFTSIASLHPLDGCDASPLDDYDVM